MKTRIYLIMTGENLFHPYYVLGFLRNLPKEYKIVGITIARDKYKKGFFHFLKEQWYLWGTLGFLYISVNSAGRKLFDRFKFKKHLSLQSIGRDYGVPVIESFNVNKPEHLRYLKDLKIDIIISSCGHIFKDELLSLPKTACINRHSALLPKYGGVLPVFWAMYFEEKEFGVSVHYMVEEIDQGDILAQEITPLLKKNSLFKNYLLAFDKSIVATIEALENLKKGKIVGRYYPNKRQYFSFPSFEKIKKLKVKGYKTFTLKDMLSDKF